MPSIYDLKPRFQALLRPAVRALVERGVTPNHLTASAVVGSVLAGLLIPLARERPVFLLTLPLWLFARPPGALDHAVRCPSETQEVALCGHRFLPLLALTFTLGAVPACQAQWRVAGAPVCTAANVQAYTTIVPDGAGATLAVTGTISPDGRHPDAGEHPHGGAGLLVAPHLRFGAAMSVLFGGAARRAAGGAGRGAGPPLGGPPRTVRRPHHAGGAHAARRGGARLGGPACGRSIRAGRPGASAGG